MGKQTGKAADRRGFLRSTAVGAGLAMWAGAARTGRAQQPRPRNRRLPREVWIASITQHGIRAGSHSEMTQKVLARMEEIVPFQPDLVCLPEIFPFTNLTSRPPKIEDVAEEPIGEISRPFAEFAAKNHCYVVCPIYTARDGRFYNSAVLIDRQGQAVGEYNKAHPTTGEMDLGVSAGTLDPPVFETDFGKVGCQICFDIEWSDCWQVLQEKGAEVVVWPSAFAGGSMVNSKASLHHYCVVSSTNKDTSKICDISGVEVARTGRWNNTICAAVNLEKAFLHTWPYVQRFSDIHAKYGRSVRIQNFAEEEWTIIESRSPDVKIADVLKEFDLLTHTQHLQAADTQQCGCRTA